MLERPFWLLLAFGFALLVAIEAGLFGMEVR